METNYKAIVIISLVIVALFAGGLYTVVQENNSRRLAYRLIQEYLNATPGQQVALEVDIRSHLDRKSLALTSRASIDSFEQLLANAKACDVYAEGIVFSTSEQSGNYEEAWLSCMDHPEVLLK